MIIEIKKIKVVKSRTPYWILLKWDKKEKDWITSVNHKGAHDLTLANTSPNPAITIIKQLIVETIKAITWFFVNIERQEVKDKKHPAINQLPK